jgi:hypothetical protein
VPDLNALGIDVAVVLAFLFVGWYLVGGMWQRRVRGRYVRTLGEAARSLSRSRSLPRIAHIGQSGFQLVIGDAVDPFAKVAIVTMLSPREALALWLVNVLRRRGDRVVVRADLRDRPRASRDAGPLDDAVRELSVSDRSPHLIATLDADWVRAHDPDAVAAEIAKAGARAAQ